MTSWLGTFGRNKLLKFLSLLLAIALWVAVSGEERIETTLNLTLEMVNLPQNLTVTSEVPPLLQVRVIGSRSIVNNLSQARLTQALDLAGYKSGRHTFYLGPNSFAFPRGVQIIRIQPNPINLTLAATITRTLPIKPVLENTPPEGYEVVSTTIRPAQVTVKGPSLELADLKFISTFPIDLSHLREPTTIATDLDFKNLHLALTEPMPILAVINIAARPLTRTFSEIPVLTVPPSVQVSPAQVSLTIKGPWPQVQNLNPDALKVQLDTRNLSPGRHQLKLPVELPDGVDLVRSRPGTVSVTIPKPELP